VNWRSRQIWPFYGALVLTAVVASFAFWGSAIAPSGGDGAGEIGFDGDWLSQPIPPSLDLDSGPGGAAPLLSRHWGQNPFMDASEHVSFDGPLASVSGHMPDEVAGPGLELHALIDTEGDRIALIDGIPVRVGEKAEGVLVVRIDGKRVLVDGADGRAWLELASREGFEIKEAN